MNQLQSECPNLVADIPVCQSTYSKKIILSLGGSSQTYQLSGASEGVAFADFLWGTFGPQNTTWLKHGQPRPFDGPNGQAVEVDGFDFDIETPSSGAFSASRCGYPAHSSKILKLATLPWHQDFVLCSKEQARLICLQVLSNVLYLMQTWAP